MPQIIMKFDGHCRQCRTTLKKGREVIWLRDEEGKGHVYCDTLCQEKFETKEEEYEIPENPDGIPQGSDHHDGQGQGGNGQGGEGGEKQQMKDHEAHQESATGYKKRQDFIKDALDKSHNSGEIYQNVKDRIGKDERWTIRKNTGNGERGEAYDVKEQESKMNYYIRRLAAEWEKETGNKQGKGGPPQPGAPMGEMQDGGTGTPPTPENPIEYFYRRTKEIRAHCDKNAGVNDATRIDQISLRPIVNGIAAIKEGVNPDALLYSMICHWSAEEQEEVGVKPVPISKMGGKKIDGEHDMMGYVLALATARVPIMLVGPAGTGKSFMARALARLMFDNDDSHYGEAPLTAGAMPSWLIGAETVAGYKSRPFLEIYEHGGVFNFEEIDAADANMLMVLNNALAQDRFYNPANGKVYKKHDDFIAVSTGNTWGLGANRFYNAREKLDFATRDRWRMGRVKIELDTKVERGLVDQAIAEMGV